MRVKTHCQVGNRSCDTAKHVIRCWVNRTDCTRSPWDESSRLDSGVGRQKSCDSRRNDLVSRRTRPGGSGCIRERCAGADELWCELFEGFLSGPEPVKLLPTPSEGLGGSSCIPNHAP